MNLFKQQLDADVAREIEIECFSGDPEADHINADNVLCRFLQDIGFEKTLEMYNEVKKWYA